MMHINEKRRAAHHTIELLRRSLIDVIGWSLHQPRPVIHIKTPSTAWFKGIAIVEMTETNQGIRRQVSIARLNGCLIRWTKTA